MMMCEKSSASSRVYIYAECEEEYILEIRLLRDIRHDDMYRIRANFSLPLETTFLFYAGFMKLLYIRIIINQRLFYIDTYIT